MESYKDVNPGKIDSPKEVQDALYILLNTIEDVQEENRGLKLKIAQLLDENNRLKGGNGRPDIKPSKKYSNVNISSKGREQGDAVNRSPKNKADQRSIEIDQEIKVEMPEGVLPADAVFKGYSEYIQQDLRIVRNNKRYLFAVYYSALEGKTYKAPLPKGEIEGHFGAGISGLTNILYHYGNVTESKLCGLLAGFGIAISSGSISNLLKAGHKWSVQEQSAILQAGLENVAPKQMDSTGNRENGVNKTTHIIASPSFSVFYTLGSKTRVDCLQALQGNPGQDLQLQWYDGIEELWQKTGVKKADCHTVITLLKENEMEAVSKNAFEKLLENKAPDIYKKERIVNLLSDPMALHYYRQQDNFRPLAVLLTDDAPEYNKIALHHALCWVHDARYYNKLEPRTEVMKDKLETFKTLYWEFYRTMLNYKNLPEPEQPKEKGKIAARFDELFGKPTCYGALDLCIERTRANKEKLLRVLDFPDLPLHNNAAELAARRVVRKRDISLHTMTEWGTQLRDAFLSIIETAQKLGISAYEYIMDRITKANNMPALAQIIKSQITRTF